jgi:hypothetical protein
MVLRTFLAFPKENLLYEIEIWTSFGPLWYVRIPQSSIKIEPC